MLVLDVTFMIQTRQFENGTWNTAILMKFPIRIQIHSISEGAKLLSPRQLVSQYKIFCRNWSNIVFQHALIQNSVILVN